MNVTTSPARRRGHLTNALSRLATSVVFVALGYSSAIADDPTDADRLPNIVIIFTDDQGYGDVGCYGAEGWETPHLDRMAAEGVRFTDFYVSQAVCGASRASLLTGCYANRIGMLGAPGPRATHGISDNEMIIPQLLKQKNYACAIYGKWHLGHREPFLPRQHGFDDYYGIPYSNDMWPNHPTSRSFPDLPLFEDNEIIELNSDQRQFTTEFTRRACAFIEEHKDQPFFVYLPHPMPHVPLHVLNENADASQQGLYGDVMQEIDWSVGEVLSTLKRLDLDEDTLVIFTCDNGPWLSYGNHAGTTGPLREGKGTAWEGGVREPCIMRWPGHIPAGHVCHELAATIDILPTLAYLTGCELPEHTIDGENIWPLIVGEEDATTPHEAYYYYWGRELHAVRSGPWKLHFPHAYRSLTGEPGQDGRPAGYTQQRTGLALFNLEDDIGESTDVKQEHPEVVARLEELAEAAREELGDSLTGRQGSGLRDPGHL